MPAAGADGDPERELRGLWAATGREYVALFGQFQFHAGLERLFAFIRAINGYVEKRAPWKLGKSSEAADKALLLASLAVMAEALRLAAVMFLLDMGLWLCRCHFATINDTFGLFGIAASTALFTAGLTWTLYLAVEPWVRRHWPRTIISWSRLLSGQGRDPLVGRDILFGVALGVVWILIFQLRYIPMMRMGAAPALFSTDALIGGRTALGACRHRLKFKAMSSTRYSSIWDSWTQPTPIRNVARVRRTRKRSRPTARTRRR